MFSSNQGRSDMWISEVPDYHADELNATVPSIHAYCYGLGFICYNSTLSYVCIDGQIQSNSDCENGCYNVTGECLETYPNNGSLCSAGAPCNTFGNVSYVCQNNVIIRHDTCDYGCNALGLCDPAPDPDPTNQTNGTDGGDGDGGDNGQGDNGDDDPQLVGPIVGGVVGGLAGLAGASCCVVIIILFFCIGARRRKKNEDSNSDDSRDVAIDVEVEDVTIPKKKKTAEGNEIRSFV